MGEKKGIFLRGAYNLFNFGDDLILISWLNFLKSVVKCKDEDITLYLTKGHQSLTNLGYKSGFKPKQLELLDLTDHINNKLKKHRLGFRFPSVRQLIEGIKKKSIQSILYLSLLAAAIGVDVLIYKMSSNAVFIKKYLDQLANVDVIHYVGGGYFADWLGKMIVYELLAVSLMKMLNPNIKVVGTGLGVGPLKNSLNRRFFKMLAKNFHYLSVRDHESLQVVKGLGIKSKVKVLGDDIILLTPYITKLQNTDKKQNRRQVALNIKDFPGHDYSKIGENMRDYIADMQSQGFEITYYCFGKKPGPDDHSLLNLLDDKQSKKFKIHDPYLEGWSRTLKHLSQAKAGISFGFHLSYILTSLGTPVVSIYCGDYYRQKIQGGLKVLKSNSLVFSIDEVRSEKFSKAVRNLSSLKHEGVKTQTLYDKMSSEYLRQYKHLLGVDRRT